MTVSYSNPLHKRSRDSALGRGKSRPGLCQSLQGRRWQPTLSLRGNGLFEMLHARDAHQGRREIDFVPGKAHGGLDQVADIAFLDQKRQSTGTLDISTVVWS